MIEELRAELNACFEPSERCQIETELEIAQAELIMMLAEQDGSTDAEPPNDICESYRCDRFIFVKNGPWARRRWRTALVALRPELARGLRLVGSRSSRSKKHASAKSHCPETAGASRRHRRWQAVASLPDAVLSLSDVLFCTRRSGVKDIAPLQFSLRRRRHREHRFLRSPQGAAFRGP